VLSGKQTYEPQLTALGTTHVPAPSHLAGAMALFVDGLQLPGWQTTLVHR